MGRFNMSNTQNFYDKDHIYFLEKLWGDGYMSPGGATEVQKIFGEVNTRNARVLDIGCGSGGITISIINEFNAKKVIGIDVEDDVCSAAKTRVKQAGLEKQIEIRKVDPGPLPFRDLTFDIVFSKDSLVHISDKEKLLKEIFRVLKPGGSFIASDWLRSHDGPPSREMLRYLELEDLGFDMASPQRYKKALREAGFTNIALENRNSWYTQQAHKELLTLSEYRRDEFEKISSAEYMSLSIETWKAMIKVLESGEHCPHHLKAFKLAN